MLLKTMQAKPPETPAIGHKLIRRPSIKGALSALRLELAESETIQPAAVIGRLRAQALTSPADLLIKEAVTTGTDPDGAPIIQDVWRFREPDELTPDQRAIVASVSLNTRHMADGSIRQTVSYKTADGQRALDALAKVLGLNRETVSHEHSGTIQHKVGAMFEFIATNPGAAETTARISRAGRGDSRRRPVLIEQTPE